MASIEMKHVYKTFGSNMVVKDFNLKIKDGEFVVFVGPSGCGKSTTLRMIAGLEEITEGEIFIGDQVVNDLQPKDRDIAMVFQNYALYPHMNVRENMSFGLKLRKYKQDEINRRVMKAADILGLHDFLERKPKELSGGQRQRVALGRAIVRNPKVFLMDEPLSNLDAKLRTQMRAELSKLHQRLKTTTIYVTHDQIEAMTMGEKIVVMNEGMIQQVDTPQQLYESPVNIFVAGFIGSPAMNFFEGKVITTKDGICFNTTGFQILLPEKLSDMAQRYLNRDVVLGIRPENLSVADVHLGNEGGGRGIPARLEVIEPLGSEQYYYLSNGDHSIVARIKNATSYSVGDMINLIPDPEKLHLFDQETTLSLHLNN